MAFNDKKWHVKSYINENATKISIIHSQHSLPFSSIKKLCIKNLNLTIHFRFWVIQFTIQEKVFRLCTKQSAGVKSEEGKQLKFALRLNKFA